MHVDVLPTHVLGHLQHAEPVVGMAVDAAGADQTHQVDGLARVDGSLHVLGMAACSLPAGTKRRDAMLSAVRKYCTPKEQEMIL